MSHTFAMELGDSGDNEELAPERAIPDIIISRSSIPDAERARNIRMVPMLEDHEEESETDSTKESGASEDGGDNSEDFRQETRPQSSEVSEIKMDQADGGSSQALESAVLVQDALPPSPIKEDVSVNASSTLNLEEYFSEYEDATDDEQVLVADQAHQFKADTRAFQHLESSASNEQDNANKFTPPDEENQIQKLVVTLTDAESDDETDAPELFSRQEHEEKYGKIAQLKTQLHDEEVEPYLEQFHNTVTDDVLQIGSISIQEVQEEERCLRAEHVAYQEQQAKLQTERQLQLRRQEEAAKKNVTESLKQKREKLKQKEAAFLHSYTTKNRDIYQSFHRAEEQMKQVLKARKAEIKTLFGDLEYADGYYGAVKGRRWKVDWTHAPQPIRIKLKCLRGIRDKLPESRYVLLLSLYDRLGGHLLRWSKLKGQQWNGSTLPVEHQGLYYNTEIKFDQSVYKVLPAKRDIRPGMVLVFELFILRGSVTPNDRVVGWGTFPISDAEFNIIEGKYKCPFLKGSIDVLIDKHSKIEELMAKDLENWLGNLYFEVIRMPRYLAGMKEYEVELQFTSALLGFPDRTHDERSAVDGNDPVYGDEDHMGNLLPEISVEGVESSSKSMDAPPVYQRRGLQSRMSRKIAENISDSSDSDEEDMLHILQDEADDDFKPVESQPGLYYKVHRFDPINEHRRRAYTMMPKTPVLNRKKKKAASYQEQLDEHTSSVKPPFSAKGKVERKSYERIQYVGRQFFAELGISQWRSLEFWATLLIILLMWWVRMYLHYLGQYAFLRIINIPVNRFSLLPHTAVLNYQSSLLFTREEMAVVTVGPLFNTVLFCMLITASWLFQKLFGYFPNLGSRFISAIGIQAVLGPYWIFLVDMILLRYQEPQPDEPTADVSKLYWHFVRVEGNGVVGIFLLLFIYFFMTFVTIASYYMYFLRVHMNGRLLDIYNRLKSPSEKIFMPHDMEISNEELDYICHKAEQWRGEEGERRKVAVYDYIWEDEELELGSVRKNKEITTHISIHTLHLDGLRELYRHFLRLDNGAIIEIFGEFGGAEFVSSGVKNAIMGRHSTVKTRASLLDDTPSRPVTVMTLGSQKRTRIPKKSLDQISQHSDSLLVPTTPDKAKFDNVTKSSSLSHRKLHKRMSASKLV